MKMDHFVTTICKVVAWIYMMALSQAFSQMILSLQCNSFTECNEYKFSLVLWSGSDDFNMKIRVAVFVLSSALTQVFTFSLSVHCIHQTGNQLSSALKVCISDTLGQLAVSYSEVELKKNTCPHQAISTFLLEVSTFRRKITLPYAFSFTAEKPKLIANRIFCWNSASLKKKLLTRNYLQRP